jgi:hypothetical protein
MSNEVYESTVANYLTMTFDNCAFGEIFMRHSEAFGGRTFEKPGNLKFFKLIINLIGDLIGIYSSSNKQ